MNLADALNQALIDQKIAAPLEVNAARCCVDSDRLTCVPNTVRCVGCQEVHKHRSRGFRP